MARTKGIVNRELVKQAEFLKTWSKGKYITYWYEGGCSYKCGKWLTRLGNTSDEALATAQALIDAKLATGTNKCFKMT